MSTVETLGREDRPHPNPSPKGEGLSRPNPVRGEAALRVGGETLVLRPTFAALVAAEGELGPLFALVDRAAEGKLSLAEMVGLFWHCLRDPPEAVTRERLGEAVVEAGLAAVTPVLRGVLRQILVGR
jgi:hypothetical protein